MVAAHGIWWWCGFDLWFLGFFFFFFFEYFISFYHNTIGCGFPDVSASGVGLSYGTSGFSFLSFFFSLNVFCYCSCFGCSFFIMDAIW